MEDNNLNLKYKCNHSESAFGEKTSSNPIEMKKENFVEYTRRNEENTYKDDYWAGSTLNGYAGGYSENNNAQSYSSQASNTNNYSQSYSKNPYNYKNNNYRISSNYTTSSSSNGKKSSSLGIWIIVIIWFLPFIFSFIGAIFEAIYEFL